MSGTVYAIASGKGGVGKTTTAINLGAMLADRDHSVVVVDTDLGMANLADFLDFEIETPTLHEVLAGEAAFEDAIYRAPGDIDVLPSATDIEAFVKSDPANLEAVVADLREKYDYVLLDTGAGVSYDTLVPLALADAVLLVATPDVASVRDTAKTGELAERVESEVRGAVLTQRSSDILNADDVEETLGTDVLAVVPQDEAVPMGIDAGRPLAAFAPNAPAGQAYRELAAVLTGDADPDPELDLADEGDGEDDHESADEDGTSEPTDADDELDADPFTGAELAGNVRDAIGEDDGTEKLLGGELANAADEIREQTEAGSATSPDSETERGRETRAGESGDEDASAGEENDGGGTDSASKDDRAGEGGSRDGDASGGEDESAASFGTNEARSVDDLIDEHISDERLADSNSQSGDADPLAQMSGDSSSGGESDTDFLDEDDDPLAAEESDDAEDEDDPFAAEDDPLAAGSSADRAESPTAADASEPKSNESASATATPEELDESESGLGESGGPTADAVPFEENEPAVPDDRRGERETGEPPQGDGESDERVSKGDSSEDDESKESDGVLGRLGSLFK
ncbi:cell division ATPase MinD [Halorussus sp. MSC15.2]|uniref:cell division ATPase MinD n=1 Tax=Halorussus sp. MSC15.2 TaxID=2283638 RepID=UPI0013D165CC|nr:cell division ATPase MinD [Halorussus sp. MSC15.2]NEU58490.1 AAA family ATPase [Halorussus sp. MSC15.2]